MRSPQCKLLLQTLREEPKAPVQLAEETGIDKSNVSTKLGQLRERDMVECLNPEDRKWRFYQLTDYGRAILTKVEEIETSDKFNLRLTYLFG